MSHNDAILTAHPHETPEQRAKRRQRGASLLEAVAYLGIAAVVILGAVALLRTAFGGANLNRAAQEITGLETSIRRLFATQGVFDGGNFTNVLAQAGVIPSTLSVPTSGDRLQAGNVFQGSTAAGGACAAGQQCTNFWIRYTNVPTDACVSLVTTSSATLIQVAAGAGTNLGTLPTAVPAASATAQTGPVGASAASTMCAAARNAVTFYF